MVTEDYFTNKLRKIVGNKKVLYHIKSRCVKNGNYKMTLWFSKLSHCDYVMRKCRNKGLAVNGPFELMPSNDYFSRWCEIMFDDENTMQWGIGHTWVDTWLCKFPDGEELITRLHKTAQRLTFATMKEAGKYIVQNNFYGVSPKQIKNFRS